jgi:peroxiredoxin Q/BCP
VFYIEERETMTELREGDVAPDFTLPLDDGSSFTLSAEKGRPVVLYFYPEDDSGGCTDENREFSDRAKAFADLGARLVGISPDTVESHIKFRKKYGLVLPLASDPDHLAIEPFGLWKLKKLYGREFMGLIRTSFIVGADGKVARITRATRILGHAQKMLEALEQHVAK